MESTQILQGEHRVIEKVLDVLADAVREIQAGHRIEAGFFLRAVDFIRTYADRVHHAKEEDLLFPAMTARGVPREEGPIAVMLQEHELGRSHVKAMEEAARRLEAGESGALQEVARHAGAFVELLRQHIFKEDNILYPMAEQVLTAEDDRQLLARYAQAEERLGPELGPRYVQIAQELSQTKLVAG